MKTEANRADRDRQVNDWDAANPMEGAGMVAAGGGGGRQAVRTFFERITKDIEIVRVALLLTGCIQVYDHIRASKGY